VTEVQAIHARFTGDTSSLDAAVRNATTRMDRFNDRMRKAAKRAADLGAAAGVATGAITAAGSAILRTADEIGKAAQAAGVTTDQLQELRFAFGQVAGTSARQVDQALQRFSVAIGEARQGTGEYLDTIKQLNVNLSQDTPAALEETLTALSQIEDDADRAAAASALFGTRAGPRLAGALKGGTEAVQALRDAIQRDGGVISAENIDNAEAFNDQMDRLSKVVTADLANTMLENADAMESLAEGMAGVASAAVSGIAGLARFGSSIGAFLGERAGKSYREELQEQLGTGSQPQRMRSFFRDRVASGPAAPAAESGSGASAEDFFSVPQGMGGQLGIAASAEDFFAVPQGMGGQLGIAASAEDFFAVPQGMGGQLGIRGRSARDDGADRTGAHGQACSDSRARHGSYRPHHAAELCAASWLRRRTVGADDAFDRERESRDVRAEQSRGFSVCGA